MAKKPLKKAAADRARKAGSNRTARPGSRTERPSAAKKGGRTARPAGDPKPAGPPQAAAPSPRVLSIDALRGFDMFWIMGGDAFFPALFALVGTPFLRGLSRQFEHSAWDGFTFYDLIFPLFLFIVGLSMPFSLGRRMERREPRVRIALHIVKRTLLLILFGLVYNGLLRLDFDTLRVTGVLQRIGLAYGAAAFLFLYTGWRTQAAVSAAVLLGYWAVMTLVPVPGFGPGLLTPEGNLAAYVDQRWLPGTFCCYTYGDNEGLISHLPAVVTALLGVLAGTWVRSPRKPGLKAAWLAAAGLACLALGLAWDTAFPINKLYWSSSYVLYAGGWSLLLFALFYWIIDVRGWKAWAFPFVVIGLNPITIYVVQGLFDFGVIVSIFTQGFADRLGPAQPAFWALALLLVKWLFLYHLYRQKIFLRV